MNGLGGTYWGRKDLEKTTSWVQTQRTRWGEESAWQSMEKRLRNTKCKDWEARSVWPDQTEEGQEETKEARSTEKELSHRPMCYTHCTIIAAKPYWRQYRNSKTFNEDQVSFFLYNPLALACVHIVSWSQIGCQGSRHCLLHPHESRRETALLSTKKTKVSPPSPLIPSSMNSFSSLCPEVSVWATSQKAIRKPWWGLSRWIETCCFHFFPLLRILYLSLIHTAEA